MSGMLSFATLPHEIWHEVLVKWLDNLRDTIRLDCALCSITVISPLRSVYANRSFRFAGHASHLSVNVLVRLCTWMRSRKVYASHLTFEERANLPLAPQWSELFAWCRDSLESMTVESELHGTSKLLPCASFHLRGLRTLKIENWNGIDIENVNFLMEVNARTLVAVLTKQDCNTRVNPITYLSSYPHLKVLSWGVRCLSQLLPRCPSLVALAIDGEHHGFSNRN